MMKRDLPRGDPPLHTIRREFSLRSLLSVIAIAAGFWLMVQIWQIILLLVIAFILAGTLSPLPAPCLGQPQLSVIALSRRSWS
jgi:hypothetical protein